MLLLGLGFNFGVAPVFAETVAAAPPNPISAGDTAWMLISSALVLLMTPGLAFFYGGLVRSRNVLNTMMMSLVAMGVIGVTWVLWGYSLAFDVTPGKSGFGEGIEAFIGGLDWIFRGVLINFAGTNSEAAMGRAACFYEIFWLVSRPLIFQGRKYFYYILPPKT